MSEKQKLTVNVDADTSKLQLKLKAIAKHAEALAYELEAIDGACDECGSMEYIHLQTPESLPTKKCAMCGEEYIDTEVHKATS